MVDPYPDAPAQRTSNTGTWIDRHRSPRAYNQMPEQSKSGGIIMKCAFILERFGQHSYDTLRIRIAKRGDIEQRRYLYTEGNSRLHISRFEGLVGVGWILPVGACLPVGPCLVDERVMQPEQWIGR